MEDKLLAHIGVHFLLFLIHADAVFALDQLWHPQMVCGFHGDGDVGDFLVNPLLGSGQRCIGEHHLSVALIRFEVILPILRNEPPQTLSHVEYLELREQVHQAVAGWRSRQPDDSLRQWANLHECLEAFTAPTFERGEFVNHDGIVGEVCFLDEPRHVLAVDDVEGGLLAKRIPTFFLRSDYYGVAEMFQMLPLADLLRPCVSCHSERRDDEDTGNLKAVKQQVVEGCESNHRLSKSHIEEYSSCRVAFDKVDGILLVIMRYELHGASPPICKINFSITETLPAAHPHDRCSPCRIWHRTPCRYGSPAFWTSLMPCVQVLRRHPDSRHGFP